MPYDDFDPEVIELCKTINEFPGIITSSSCQGFLNGHRADEPWHVFFQCDGLPSLEGYASIEFLVYLRREAIADGFDIQIGVAAPPPMLNGICESMYFTIECRNRTPNEYAAFIRRMRENLFYIPIRLKQPWPTPDALKCGLHGQSRSSSDFISSQVVTPPPIIASSE